jgi:hypothetical protein
MKVYFLIYFSLIYYVKYSSATLVDGIVTLSWSRSGSSPVVDRFLTSNTQIQLQLLCREPSTNTNQTQDQIRKSLSKAYEKTKVQISGRIGRVVGCLPLQSDSFMTANKLATKDKKDLQNTFQAYYEDLWKEMEIRKFVMEPANCEYSGALSVNDYGSIIEPEISPEKALELRKKLFQQDEEQSSKIKSFLFFSLN